MTDNKTSVVQINPAAKLELAAAKPDRCMQNIENIKLDVSDTMGNIAVATNGCMLAVVPITIDGDNDLGLISPEALKAARKNKPLAGTIQLNGKLDIPCGPSFPRPTEADAGNYPRWQTVVPTDREKVKFTIGLNPELLIQLAQAIGWEKGNSVKLEFIDEQSPIRLTIERENGYGLLMPMRISY